MPEVRHEDLLLNLLSESELRAWVERMGLVVCGEVEERGCALTRKGRELYDQLLQQSRGSKDPHALQKAFESFPDDALTLYREGLAFVRFRVGARGATLGDSPESIGFEGLSAG